MNRVHGPCAGSPRTTQRARDDDEGELQSRSQREFVVVGVIARYDRHVKARSQMPQPPFTTRTSW